MRKSLVRFVSLIGMALIGGCNSEPLFGPDGSQGAYYLEQVNHGAPPALIWSSGSESFFLLFENLMFDGKGNVTRTRSTRVDNSVTGETRTTVQTDTAEYRISGDSIEIGRFTPCPPNALCVGNDTGKIRENQILLSSPRLNAAQLAYRKGLPV